MELLRCLLFLLLRRRVSLVLRFLVNNELIFRVILQLITFSYVISSVICFSIIIYDLMPKIKLNFGQD